MTRVVNIARELYDVYIGRPGPFGNPFIIGKLSREEVIAKFKLYFKERVRKDEEFRNKVKALKGKSLGCYCKPRACHGDTIVAYLEGETND